MNNRSKRVTTDRGGWESNGPNHLFHIYWVFWVRKIYVVFIFYFYFELKREGRSLNIFYMQFFIHSKKHLHLAPSKANFKWKYITLYECKLLLINSDKILIIFITIRWTAVHINFLVLSLLSLDWLRHNMTYLIRR